MDLVLSGNGAQIGIFQVILWVFLILYNMLLNRDLSKDAGNLADLRLERELLTLLHFLFHQFLIYLLFLPLFVHFLVLQELLVRSDLRRYDCSSSGLGLDSCCIGDNWFDFQFFLVLNGRPFHGIQVFWIPFKHFGKGFIIHFLRLQWWLFKPLLKNLLDFIGWTTRKILLVHPNDVAIRSLRGHPMSHDIVVKYLHNLGSLLEIFISILEIHWQSDFTTF